MIDLDRQFLEVFKKEELFAFFDFRLQLAAARWASGLCKISRPKEGESKSKYLSLLLIVDADDDRMWADVDSFLRRINWNRLGSELPGFKAFLTLPYHPRTAGIHFREADIYVAESVEVNRAYVADKLFPAIVKVAGMSPGELIMWDDIPTKRVAQAGPAPAPVTRRSATEQLKDFLFSRISGI